MWKDLNIINVRYTSFKTNESTFIYSSPPIHLSQVRNILCEGPSISSTG